MGVFAMCWQFQVSRYSAPSTVATATWSASAAAFSGSAPLAQQWLVGTRSNRDAVGAQVRVLTATGWQTRAVAAGSAFLSTQSLVQHIGLGPAVRAAAPD